MLLSILCKVTYKIRINFFFFFFFYEEVRILSIETSQGDNWMKLYELLQISYDRSLDPSIIIIHVIPYKNLAKNHSFLAVSLTSFIYNVQPSPIFLSACTITRFLWFERGVGGQASQYRPLSPVICEKCSKRYPRNKFPRNFPSYSSGKSLRSFDLSSLLPISPFPLRLSSSLG